MLDVTAVVSIASTFLWEELPDPITNKFGIEFFFSETVINQELRREERDPKFSKGM